ncbi:hypothetical protein NQ318_016867 [Aromia moschata]|uniref:Uncharacterized protein n=1 Tax=Aromia moschata TaxID=1265417 RepID=A0AAV8X4M8_9CUCU|nr:hypothetical protein NQ318_016867 [Aromia moschata]
MNRSKRYRIRRKEEEEEKKKKKKKKKKKEEEEEEEAQFNLRVNDGFKCRIRYERPAKSGLEPVNAEIDSGLEPVNGKDGLMEIDCPNGKNTIKHGSKKKISL